MFGAIDVVFKLHKTLLSARAIKTLLIAVSAALALALNALAQPMAPPQFIAGDDYQVLSSPLKMGDEDKIEVMEVFWYGCGHCMRFEPMVRAWKKRLADDVQFMRTPAVWGKKGTKNNDLMQAHARLYFAADALGLPDEIHDELFRMIVANRRLQKPEEFESVFAKFGADAKAFNAALSSFTTQTRVNRGANAMVDNYQVEGTPEMIVNGRYRVTSGKEGGQQRMLQVVDFLIDIERKRIN